ncbi:MAG TPA: hypothetical protein VH024_16850 [Candidatus Angelobacter sp.]|nr:hypothetical protein [Candidatus Angelobacter sp.]
MGSNLLIQNSLLKSLAGVRDGRYIRCLDGQLSTAPSGGGAERFATTLPEEGALIEELESGRKRSGEPAVTVLP